MHLPHFAAVFRLRHEGAVCEATTGPAPHLGSAKHHIACLSLREREMVDPLSSTPDRPERAFQQTCMASLPNLANQPGRLRFSQPEPVNWPG